MSDQIQPWPLVKRGPGQRHALALTGPGAAAGRASRRPGQRGAGRGIARWAAGARSGR